MAMPRYNTYVGMRYVPIFDGEWDRTKTYEPLTIVSYQGNSYTSRTFIPTGMDINNTEYWALTGNYNAQVEYYRQEVAEISEKIEHSIKCYPNVATMKEDEYISVGNICKTIGYYNNNGGAFYVVSDTASSIYVELDNGLYALLACDGYITPEMCGGYGDETHDDTVAIQTAIDSQYDVLMLNNYLISSPLNITSEKNITCKGKIKYTGNDSAIVVSYSKCKLDIHEIETYGNGIEMKPLSTSADTSCQFDEIICNRIYCRSANSIGLYVNCEDAVVQFCDFNINRIQGEWNTTTAVGIKIKTLAQNNKYCNANHFNINSICYCSTAILADNAINACISNYFNNINFEQNVYAIDMPNARFELSGCFDEGTSGKIKITNGTVCNIIANGILLDSKIEYDSSVTYGCNIHISGRIVNAPGVYLTDNIHINEFGAITLGAVTPFTSSSLTSIISDVIVKYINIGDTITLPPVRKGGLNGSVLQQITIYYSTVSGTAGDITLAFTDGTTRTVTLPSAGGKIIVVPNGNNTGVWVYF